MRSRHEDGLCYSNTSPRLHRFGLVFADMADTRAKFICSEYNKIVGEDKIMVSRKAKK